MPTFTFDEAERTLFRLRERKLDDFYQVFQLIQSDSYSIRSKNKTRMTQCKIKVNLGFTVPYKGEIIVLHGKKINQKTKNISCWKNQF